MDDPPSLRIACLAALALVAIPGRSAAFVAGDGNRDGVLSAPDLTVLRRILSGTDAGVLEADANGDGFILADDLELTLRRIFGDEPAAPTATPTASSAATATRSATPTEADTRTATPSRSPAATATHSATATATHSRTATPSRAPSPSASPSAATTASATASATPTAATTASATASATPTATATPSPAPSAPPGASPSPTRTVGATMRTYCDAIAVPVEIPDLDGAGLVRTIEIEDGARIDDLNAQLDVAHPFAGDLRIVLTHVDSGTSVVLLDRPGLPPGDNGCPFADVLATFDDEAGRLAEDACEEAPPAVFGSVRPGGALGAFDGETIGGTWRLAVADLAKQDVGALFGWCLQVNSLAPVVAAFTCDGGVECAVELGQPFSLTFTVADPDGDAAAWEMIRIRDDGQVADAASGAIVPAAGMATIAVAFDPFVCPGGSCRTTIFDYQVEVGDAAFRRSPPARVRVVVPGLE